MSHEPIQSVNNLTLRRTLFLLILTLLCVSGLVGSDLYLPMMPSLAHQFSTTVSETQWSLGVYLLGLSLSQLIHGPLSDRFGRKRLALVGISLYLLSSLGCALSTHWVILLIFRFTQALGAASGLVVGRAIIGDVYSKQEGGKVFATIFPLVGMSPAISPLIGGLVGIHFGWQGCFWVLSLFCVILLFLLTFFLKETLKHPASLHPVKIVKDYAGIASSPVFWRYALGPCFGYAIYFGYLTESPFIFTHFGFRPDEFGCLYLSLSITYVIGNLVGKRLLRTRSLDECLKLGYTLFLCAGLGLGTLLIPLPAGVALTLMMLWISLATFSNGFLLPLGTAGTISSFSHAGGLASGFLGFLQLGSAAASAWIINAICHVSLAGLFYFVCPVTAAAWLSFYISHKKHLKKEALRV